jgi:hypothetical protein
VANPYVLNPQFADQAKFLKELGAEVTIGINRAENPSQLILKYNSMVEELIRSGRINREHAIFASETYVDKKGLLVFSRFGDPAPTGTTPLTEFHVEQKKAFGPRSVYANATNDSRSPGAKHFGIISAFDYHLAIAKGHFPVGITSALVQGVSGSEAEPVFFHDLAHLGGFVAEPDGMKSFRQAAEAAVTKYPADPPATINRRLFFVNEVLTLFRPGAFEELNSILMTFNVRPCTADESKFEEICIAALRDQLVGLSASEIENLVKKLNRFSLSFRLPFGAIARTGGTDLSSMSKIDILIKELGDEHFLWELKKINLVQQARYRMAQYISAALNLSKTDIQGWFDLALSLERPPKGPYLNYLCGIQVEGDNWSKDFCSQ